MSAIGGPLIGPTLGARPCMNSRREMGEGAQVREAPHRQGSWRELFAPLLGRLLRRFSL